MSYFYKNNAGLPQRSVLGPSLVILDIDDLFCSTYNPIFLNIYLCLYEGGCRLLIKNADVRQGSVLGPFSVIQDINDLFSSTLFLTFIYVLSSFYIKKIGVPQGSVVGSLLIILDINDVLSSFHSFSSGVMPRILFISMIQRLRHVCCLSQSF